MLDRSQPRITYQLGQECFDIGGPNSENIGRCKQCDVSVKEILGVRVTTHREQKSGIGASFWIEFNPPEVWARPHPLLSARYELQMKIQGLHQRDGPWSLRQENQLVP